MSCELPGSVAQDVNETHSGPADSHGEGCCGWATGKGLGPGSDSHVTHGCRNVLIRVMGLPVPCPFPISTARHRGGLGLPWAT